MTRTGLRLLVATALTIPGVAVLAVVPASASSGAAKAPTCHANQLPADADFNSDRKSDLVVGIPGADHGAGAVEVRTDYSASKVQLLRSGSDDSPGPHRAGNGFGTSIAVGPLNSDGCADLVIGIPRLTVHGVKGAGGVQVLFGRPKGFVAGPLITRASPGVPGTPSTNEHFGFAVNSYYYSDRNYYDEGTAKVAVFVGVPGASVPGSSGTVVRGAGEVVELDYPIAAAKALPEPSALLYYQGHGVNGAPVAGAHLGQTLGSVGSWPAVGAPDERVAGNNDAGFWGDLAPDGSFASDYFPRESFTGSVAGELLGASFVDQGGPFEDFDDASGMVGAPGMTVNGHHGAGAVAVYYQYLQSPDDPLDGSGMLTQNSPGVPGKAATGAHFGAALTQAPYPSRRTETLEAAIAVPGQRVAGHPHAGAVIILNTYGINTKASPKTTYQLVDQATAHIPGVAERGDFFGTTITLATRSLTASTATSVLLVGDPGEDLGKATNAGALELVHLTARGLSTHHATILSAAHPASDARYGAGIINGSI